MNTRLEQTSIISNSSDNLQNAIPKLSRTLLPTRSNIENLSLEYPGSISESASLLHTLVDSENFAFYLLRALAKNLKPAAFNLLELNHTDNASALKLIVNLAKSTISNAHTGFTNQYASGKLTASEATLRSVFASSKYTTQEFQGFYNDLGIKQKYREAMTSAIRQSFCEAAQTTLLVSQHLVRKSSFPNTLLHINNLNLSYIPQIENLKTDLAAGGEKSSELKFLLELSRAAKTQHPRALRDFLLEIDTLPSQALSSLPSGTSRLFHLRLKKALAGLLTRCPSQNISDAHFKTVRILKDVLSKDEIKLHAYKRDNLSAVVDKLFKACLTNKINLSMASCPDYSGTIQTDVTSGRQVKKYDFEKLGTQAGSVAERGLAFVKAWHDALVQNGINVLVTHFEGTFEIADGFTSKLPDQCLTYEQAFKKLELSGIAVKQLFEAQGIQNIQLMTTHEVINDQDFKTAKVAIANGLLSRTDPQNTAYDESFSAFVRETLQGRKALYHEWYPRNADEQEHTYIQRLTSTIVLQNVGEYTLLGEILTRKAADGAETLVLAYDSPIMGEVYAMNGLAVISGQGANSADYIGA